MIPFIGHPIYFNRQTTNVNAVFISKKITSKIKSKILLVALLMSAINALAQSEQRMQEIAASAAALMQEAALAAKADDAYKACTKIKEGVLL